jgi:hypothetical protein
VLHLRLERVHVEGAQQHLLDAGLQLQRQDRRVELLVGALPPPSLRASPSSR